MRNSCKTLGERLKTWRKAENLSGATLGEKLGCTQASVSSWEIDRTSPPVERLVALYWLGLNINWLLTGEGPMLVADLAPAAAAEQGTPEKLAELEARLKALEERESKAATARKTKAKPARINGAHIKA